MLEALGIERAWLDMQQVAVPARFESAVSQDLAQLGDVDLDALRRFRRRLLAPELVDQAVDRDDLVRVHQQRGQERALLRRPERDRAARLEGLDRPEDAELHVPAEPSTVESARTAGSLPRTRSAHAKPAGA